VAAPVPSKAKEHIEPWSGSLGEDGNGIDELNGKPKTVSKHEGVLKAREARKGVLTSNQHFASYSRNLPFVPCGPRNVSVSFNLRKKYSHEGLRGCGHLGLGDAHVEIGQRGAPPSGSVFMAMVRFGAQL
jgi:hypothetical protein